jgi:dipeptidase
MKFMYRTCAQRLLLLYLLPMLASACTTLVAGRGATVDGSVLTSHSNDGDGTTIGNLQIVEAANWSLPQTRPVSGGSVPQVAHTYAYFTKVGGYASINEHQVGLAESTCNAVFFGQREKAVLNIVDLSELGLERANTSRAAVAIMGALAEAHGYYDAGESLFVVDPAEAFIFHVLPDPSGTSAVWVAQRVPDSHVGVVANAFTVRVVDLNDSHAFLYSKTMVDVALATGRWRRDLPFDFTRIFSGPELGHKYASGRRMWAAFRALAPAASVSLSPTYTEFVSASHYPATLPATNVSAGMLRATMRNYYAGTPYDMSVGMAAGAAGSPIRGLPLSASPRH